MSDANISVIKNNDPDSTPVNFDMLISKLKIDVLTHAGRLDFLEADAKIRLAQVRLQMAENEKLGMQVDQLETQYKMFILENQNEEK